MMIDYAKFMTWLLPSLLIVGAFLVGLLFEKIISRKLKSIFRKSKWKNGEIVIKGIRGMIILWFGIAGIYGALVNIPLEIATLAVLKKILLILVILSVTIALARIAKGFIDSYAKKTGGLFGSTSIFQNLTKLLIFLIGILIILQFLGISITPILTALGVGGLAVALALQDTLSNLFSGLQIIASKQIRPGDYVELDSGEKGYVTDITWKNTTIRALPNNMIVVPNSKLASTIITNYYQPDKVMSVLVQVGVSYESNLAKVEKVTIEVAKEIQREIEGAVPEFEPFIRYHTFDDFSINFTVILRAQEFINQYILKLEFVKKLHDRYKKEGIVIPFPIRTVFMAGEKD